MDNFYARALPWAAIPGSRGNSEGRVYNEYLTADDGVVRLAADDGALLTTGRQQCRAKFGGFRVAVPPSVRMRSLR